jgi:cytoskeletal protein CcmA (bactofilin family)/ribosomal protein L40E
MKKPNLQEVTCPHCHGTQSEPAGAISTNCRKCGRYFKLKTKSEHEARTTRTHKDTREVVCVKCGAPNLVAVAAFSTQCIKCSNYIELGKKVVKGVQTAKFYAHDDVLFEEGCSFKGMEATGRRMDVRGKVFSNLRATEEIIAAPGCSISGELHAPTVRIERGSTVRVQALTCDRLLVSGAVEISGKLTAGEIVLSDGAVFTGRLTIPESKLKIDAGATVHFDAIICGEFMVEGNVTLGTGLTAEKLTVASGGVLTSPVVRAARVEVSPGGRLQALIEKYIPIEKPKEPEPVAEPESKAEAA